jgi:hypothetical protein
MRRLESILLVVLFTGCASTDARWVAGVTRETDRVLPVVPVSEVLVFMKPEFGAFDLEWEKRPMACHSTTLVRKMGLLEGPTAVAEGDVEALGELTTEEFPRDEARSKIKGKRFGRTFGVGTDESDLFEVYPSPRSIEKGVARLKEMASELGADEVRDVYFTGYVEHQMWEGDVVSLTPNSPDSPFYNDIQLLELRLRDVRFHGTAVRRRGR